MSYVPSWPSLPDDTAPPVVQDDEIQILVVDDQKSNLEVLDALLAQLDAVGQVSRGHIGVRLGQRGRGRLQADHP